ncbi:hypothetical protein [Sorangium cellulosum]|uniref:hypothetical protein n=1 Tax=Sorangium cellulosum TaxID=56 RepID=UPI0013315BBB|nr:hypothetical protein [Sorangium cellulosum]
MTVAQRTSGDMRLNPYLHVVFLDGAYHEDGTELVWNELGHLREPQQDGMVRLSPRYTSSRCAASFTYAPLDPEGSFLMRMELSVPRGDPQRSRRFP